MYYLWLQRVRCYCILTLAVVRIAPPYVCVVTWCFRKARNKQCSVLRRVLEGLGQHCDCLTNSYHLLLVTVLCIQDLPLTSCSSSQFTSCLPSFSPVTGAQIRNHIPNIAWLRVEYSSLGYTGSNFLCETNFGTLQNPNQWESGLQIWISCRYVSYVGCTQAI